MAYTTIDKSSLHMNTKLYVGDGTSTQAITGVGFQPDWVWIKDRDASHDHYSFQSIFSTKYGVEPSDTIGERNPTLGSFDSDGFTFASSDGFYNDNGDNYVSWNWKAGGAGSSNTDGSITTNVSANSTAGFSMLTYTGTGSNGTIGHGLGVQPKMVFIKRIDTDGTNWVVMTVGSASSSPYKIFGSYDAYLKLNNLDNLSGALATGDNRLATNSSTTYINIGNDSIVNNSGGRYVAYVFAEKTGYSKFGMYHNNGNADGPFCYTGFKPELVIIKSSDRSTSNWNMLDRKRPGYNVTDYRIKISGTTEQTGNVNCIDILSNGFKIRGVDDDVNAAGAGDDYIYMAWGQSLVGSNDVPCTGF